MGDYYYEGYHENKFDFQNFVHFGEDLDELAREKFLEGKFGIDTPKWGGCVSG